MDQKVTRFKGIKDIFYQTRVLMGREYTLKRFASEILGGRVEAVMLSYIEKGKRFPTEALVRRLAQVRREVPEILLVFLWRDRMLYAFSRELHKAIKGEDQEAIKGLEQAEVAALISRAIAALPDDGTWISLTRWQADLNRSILSLGANRPSGLLTTVMDILKTQGLVEEAEGKVRRLGGHYIAESPDEKHALAVEFCGIFTKGLLGKVVLKEQKTYLRNHYLQIPEDQIAAFYQKLNAAVNQLTTEFASEEGEAGKFLNVLITSSPS
ncbi:MAG: hypothetical protein VST69_07290 [Nitrospirota bacterium]|nr:hypothetical protein [Nitrospirota bacterium]